MSLPSVPFVLPFDLAPSSAPGSADPGRSRLHGARVLALLLALAVAFAGPTLAEPRDANSSEAASSDVASSEAGAGETGAGDTEADDRDEPEEVIYELVTVVGSGDRAARVPGSAHVVSAADLAKYQYEDVHRILRQVPGVEIQEEDGYGLRPNIGLRGTGVERSQKITLLEDGVLIAPAPYSAPSAYYSPTAGRMEALEVRKGSSTIRQGPQTNGGVINYVSTSIPGEPSGKIELSGGNHGTAKLRASGGATGERFGFLVETFQHQTDGFKDLDGGGDTGFELSDYLAKVRIDSSPESSFYQSLELKVGHTEQKGDETYLGLTAADFERTPFRRYVGSQQDTIDTDHDQVVLRWFGQPSRSLELTATAYRNEFFRDWYKNESTLGVRNGSILSDPERYGDALAVLRGEVDSVDDALKLRHNRRTYYSQGVQTSLTWAPETSGKANHTFELGLRWHEDEEDRFQEEDGWAVRDARMVLTSVGAPGSQANRVASAEALALFVQDEIRFGRFTLTPGLRYENVDLERLDYGRSDPERTGSALRVRENGLDAWMPGIGLHADLGSGWGLVAGVHRGFSPPSPSSTEPVDPEESINWELGLRWLAGSSSLEAMVFYNDYSNLLGTDTASGGGTGTGDQFNGGEVVVQGLELGWSSQLVLEQGLRVPVRFAYTYTRGEFDTSFETGFADWSPEVQVGDELPYLPEHRVYAEIGLELDAFAAFLNIGHVSEMRTTAGQGAIPEAERIEDHVTVDASASFDFAERYRLLLNVRNLTDEVYVAARRPYGLRPGLSRTTSVGLSVRF